MHHKTRGFTIVELLVVIVVIAILAAITIASYNGIQQRARNSATIQAASTSIKLITMYYNANGAITLTDLPSGSWGTCIGTAASYPASSHLAAGSCYPHMNASAQLEAALGSIGVMNLATYEFDTGGGNYSRGIQYSFDGDAFVWYDLIGSGQDCQLSGSENLGDGDNETDCRVNMTKMLGESPINF